MSVACEWAERIPEPLPDDERTVVALSVSGSDRPEAIVLATTAPLALAVVQHDRDLSEVPAERLRDLLIAVRELGDVAKELEEDLTVRYRAAGASWAQLGTALDVQRATASERHARITRSRASEHGGTP